MDSQITESSDLLRRFLILHTIGRDGFAWSESDLFDTLERSPFPIRDSWCLSVVHEMFTIQYDYAHDGNCEFIARSSVQDQVAWAGVCPEVLPQALRWMCESGGFRYDGVVGAKLDRYLCHVEILCREGLATSNLSSGKLHASEKGKALVEKSIDTHQMDQYVRDFVLKSNKNYTYHTVTQMLDSCISACS